MKMNVDENWQSWIVTEEAKCFDYVFTSIKYTIMLGKPLALTVVTKYGKCI